jgi:hypothetical protein
VKLPPIDSMVWVKWHDAHAGQSTWVHRHELSEALKLVHTVGWLVRIAKNSIIICASYNAEDGGWFSDVTVIPRNCIVSIHRIGSRLK